MVAETNGSEFEFVFGFVNVFNGMHTSFVRMSVNGIMQASAAGRKMSINNIRKTLCLFASFVVFQINH